MDCSGRDSTESFTVGIWGFFSNPVECLGIYVDIKERSVSELSHNQQQ